jgi:hypothetical protein
MGNQNGKGAVHTPEHRAKISAAVKAYMSTPEARAKNSAAQTGRKHTPESRARMSLAQKGRVMTAETRAKLSAAVTGFRHTDEARAKISAAGMGNKNGRAVLSPDLAETIRSLYATGMSQRAIADQYVVGQSTVSRVIRREAWTGA